MEADVDELLHLRITGTMVELLCELDPMKYQPYITYENNSMVMYLELTKSLNGKLQAALLFWKDLTTALESWGFVPNPYNRCVSKKMVNGKQLTVLWHVDDLRVSYVDPQVVDDFSRCGMRNMEN
jgi:hypothetical protein